MLTAKEVQNSTRLGLSTIYQYREEGTFRGPRMGSKRIFGWSVLEYLADLNNPSNGQPESRPVDVELPVATNLKPPKSPSPKRTGRNPSLHFRPPA